MGGSEGWILSGGSYGWTAGSMCHMTPLALIIGNWFSKVGVV